MDLLKRCFKCQQVLPRSEFYKHKQMADGLLGKCKPCTKKDSTERRNSKIEEVRVYDRSREHKSRPNYQREYRESNPLKYQAHCVVNNAVRDGRLKSLPCEVCSIAKGVHAHHEDYSKPLDVVWLCAIHHSERHN